MLEKIVSIPINHIKLEGSLEIPDEAKGIVLFAHGSGSSRHSPRNNYVAKILRDNGLGTLLFDLLTGEEDIVYQTRFDIDLLTDRLVAATKWIKEQPEIKDLKICYFGASTGAAAALKASAQLGEDISAVVSRGGRPDLAEPDINKVKSPVLLIIGGQDELVIELNKFAYEKLNTKKQLIIIPGATHLFDEPGTLEKAASAAVEWFKHNLQ